MDQNHHCVPTWNNHNNIQDVGHPIPPPPPPPSSRALPSQSLSASLSAGPDTSMLDYEMAELTWENGQLTMHGLGLPRVPSKSSLADATLASGMLESVVNQAYHHTNKSAPTRVGGACEHRHSDDVVPWYTAPAPVSVSLDALVPNNSNNNINTNTNGVGCSTRVGSCSAAVTRVPMGSDWSVSLSASKSNSKKKRQAEDTCEQLRSMNNNNGLTSTSFAASPETTKTFTVDDHDSASQSRSQNGRGDEEDNNKKQGGTAKSTGSTKRSRAAAVHNQSERKRRDKINQRMKTLQKLVPNSNKTDKASMLDEAIEYLKNLQAQVQMLSRVSLPSMSMMMPLAIQHQLQMSSMMAPIGLGMGMGMDHMNMAGMNPMAAAGRSSNVGGVNPSHLINMAAAFNLPLNTSDGTSTNGGAYNIPQGALVSADPLSTYLACQSNPMTMDAYSKMAAIYQQHLQQQTQQQQRQNHQQPVVPSSDI